MGNEHFDVIVVGAGPAGSTCAYLLGKKGVRVALIDKAKFPRRKLCGGLLTFKTIEILKRLFEKDLNKLKKKIINFETNSYEIYWKLKKVYKNESPYPFYFTDRVYYDHFLLREAKTTGVAVIEGCKVRSVQNSGETISVLTDNGEKLSCEYLVGADGVLSVVRKYIFSKFHQKIRKEWKKRLAVAFETFIEKNTNFNSPTLFFGYVKYGYAWVFPNKDKLVVGIGALLKKDKNIREKFKDFLKDLNIKPKKVYAHLVPFGNFTIRPVFGKILLVGDSAGFVDSFTGEGIFYAHRSGEIAAYSIYKALTKNERVDELYVQLLEKYLYPELKYTKKFQNLFYFGAYHLNWSINRILFRFLGDKLIKAVHGIKSYNYLRSSSRLREPVWV